jgi:hypothetical protein
MQAREFMHTKTWPGIEPQQSQHVHAGDGCHNRGRDYAKDELARRKAS